MEDTEDLGGTRVMGGHGVPWGPGDMWRIWGHRGHHGHRDTGGVLRGHGGHPGNMEGTQERQGTLRWGGHGSHKGPQRS